MDLVSLYLGHIAAEEKSAHTLAQYGGELRRFERWLQAEYGITLTAEQIGLVTGLMLTLYYQRLYDRKLTVSTRNNYVVILKEFFEFILGAGIIAENPSTLLHCVKGKRTPEDGSTQMYTVEQIEALLTSISGRKPKCNDLRDTAIIALILGSGLRASEVCGLDIAQFHEIKSTGFANCLRKGGNWKDVAVAGFVVPHIERYLLARGNCAPEEPLFLSTKGNRLTRMALWKSLATKQKRVEISTGIHIFRHTLLTAVDHDGGSALARDIGDHRSLRVTNRYVHTSYKERLQAVNATPFTTLLD